MSYQLLERDEKIIEYLFKNKICTLDQIRNKFFKDSSKQAACRRLGKLSDRRFIEKRTFLNNNRSRTAYETNPKGLIAIKDLLRFEVDNHLYVSDSILHDLKLTDFTELFSDFEMVEEIYTESELGSCSEYLDDSNLRPFVLLRSDRVLRLKSDQRPIYVALEYEKSKKNNKRYEMKIKDYYKYNSVEAVFYICEDSFTLRAIMKVDKDISEYRKSKLYFCLLEDVQKQHKKLIFRKHTGDFVVFK